MSSFLTLSNLCAATPDGRPLFHDLTLSVGAERVGLVGRNGSGKSTLLRTITGEATPLAGTVLCTGTIGMLAQAWHPDQTVADAIGVAQPLATLSRIEAGHGDAADFDAADWALPAAIDSALHQVALGGIDLQRLMGTLSGGEQTRIGMARLLIAPPDLLLLDEPTNNLDLTGREAIARLIAEWRGGVVVASHDRELLENMDRIVELRTIGNRIVGGGWSAFAAIREAERAAAQDELTRGEAALKAARTSAQTAREAKQRRDKVGRAFAAKGSEPKILLGAQAQRAENSGGQARRLAKAQIDEATRDRDEARTRVEILTPLTIDLPASGLPASSEIVILEQATVQLGDRTLGPWTLTVQGRQRLAVTGPNGAGKSTLLRLIAGQILPSSGLVRSRRERIVMLDQQVGALDRHDTLVGNLKRLHPTLDKEAVRAACARFAFRNREAERIVGTLSGGELLRAGLAAALSEPASPWMIILDEPTNHLDIESIETLEQALRAFDGALLVASHDTRFLKALNLTGSVRVDAPILH